MKLFNAAAMQAWDEYTIREEPILSINLMERAATACVEWIIKKYAPSATFQIFCGKGNNGGDGLAIARLLTEKGYQASVNILEFGFKGSPDFQENLARLHLYPSVSICFIQLEDHIKELKPTDVIIDALFGTGLNRSLEGLSASLVKKINSLSNTIISIDIPSGLFIDKSSKGNTVIEADYTLTFQNLKLAFLVAENESFIGEPVVLDIGLLKAYEQNSISEYELIDASTNIL
jgi:NAD(P)H-hydrate epimerase